MKTAYFDGLDHNMKRELFPLWSKALEEWRKSIEKRNINFIEAKEFNWDKIDAETKEQEERDAVDADNHDCGLDEGGEGSCDNDMHRHHD